MLTTKENKGRSWTSISISLLDFAQSKQMMVGSLSQAELRTLLSPQIMLTSLETELWFSCPTWSTREKGTVWRLSATHSFTLSDLVSTTLQRLVRFIRSKTIAGEKNLSSTETDTCPPQSQSNRGIFMYLVDTSHLSQTSKGWTQLTPSSQLSGSW